MNERLVVRGPQESPIIVIGDSLPCNENTRNNLREILDRRHIIYNSIIIPLKYYINDYLYKKTDGKYRLPLESRDDIFRYINAIENSNDKWSLDLDSEKGKNAINKLKKELFDEDEMEKYKIILCLGDFSYFMLRWVFNEPKGIEKRKYVSNGTKLTIKDIGNDFAEKIQSYNYNKCIVLPILHNSSNRIFSKTDSFIQDNPQSNTSNYASYLQYIGENIVNIMLQNEDIKVWLKEI